MFPILQGLFQSVTNKMSVNECGENSLRIVTDKRIEEDSSSGENVVIEDQSLLVQPSSLEAVEIGHAAQCTCSNCDELISRFSECSICFEPLQSSGPCECPTCGGVWCVKCSRNLSKCAWCRGALKAPVAPCMALQRLINNLKLPCRNNSRGCTKLLTADIRVKHEEDCKYDAMICPMSANCDSQPLEDLAAHLQTNHNTVAVYSQKIKILIENFKTKLMNTACCKTKYKIVLLHQKSGFIIKVCIYNYHVRVEVMRRTLGYIADVNKKTRTKMSDYSALIEFQSNTIRRKSVIQIENYAFRKKAEVQCDNLPSTANDEALTIHVNVCKTDSDLLRNDQAEY